MPGYMNRILRVNLTEGTFEEESLSEELVLNYIGGRGFGIKLLYDNLPPDCDPLGADNEIIFLAGPLAGTKAQSVSRFKIFFKSPLTGGYFMSSGGGFFAPELKFAGYDAVVISGKSEKPVYLWINDGKPQLKSAAYLWGLDCDDTHTLIREELHNPKVRLACIGPAGENMVKFAGVFSDRRAAGRGGGGAVMGAKNLKAVAVRGTRKVELADPQGFSEAVKEQVRRNKEHPHFEGFSVTGTQTPEFTNILGIFPTKNFRGGVLPGIETMDGSVFTDIRARNTACHNCMVHCGSISKINKGKHRGAWSEGPEYETIWAFSGPILCSDIGLTVAADKLCDDLGLDTISTGVAIGFAYELYEKGILTTADTGGFELTYGNDKPVLPLIRQIAWREGLGAILADGTLRAAQSIGKGSEQYAIQVKGLELPAYDPRGAKAHGLNYATLNIGADHCAGYSGQEIFGVPYKDQIVDRFAIEGKGEITKFNQDDRAIYNTGVMCNFVTSYIDYELFGKLLTTATGRPEFADPEYLKIVGERIFNLERMFNIREGFSAKEDAMPARFMNEPMPDGPSAGQVFELEPLLADYYKVRGWDPETGIPLDTKLDELGLGFTRKK
jgi:aldehyde:ferredoxin oxidoreductase